MNQREFDNLLGDGCMLSGIPMAFHAGYYRFGWIWTAVCAVMIPLTWWRLRTRRDSLPPVPPAGTKAYIAMAVGAAIGLAMGIWTSLHG